MHSIPGLLISKTPRTDLSLFQAIRAGFPCQLAGLPALFPYRWAFRDWERAFLVHLPSLFQSLGSVHCLSGLESRMWLPVLWRRTASWEKVTPCQLWASGSAYPVKLSLKQRQEPTAVTLPSSRDPNPPLITLSTQKHSLPIPLCVPVASWSLQLAWPCKQAVEHRSGDSSVLLGTKEKNQAPSTKKQEQPQVQSRNKESNGQLRHLFSLPHQKSILCTRQKIPDHYCILHSVNYFSSSHEWSGLNAEFPPLEKRSVFP